MSRRIPNDAFEYYVALGADRSYQRVADHFGVSKRGIINAAERENWVERLEKIERAVRERTDVRLAETMEETRERHLRMIRGIQGRALRALKPSRLDSRCGLERVG